MVKLPHFSNGGWSIVYVFVLLNSSHVTAFSSQVNYFLLLFSFANLFANAGGSTCGSHARRQELAGTTRSGEPSPEMTACSPWTWMRVTHAPLYRTREPGRSSWRRVISHAFSRAEALWSCFSPLAMMNVLGDGRVSLGPVRRPSWATSGQRPCEPHRWPSCHTGCHRGPSPVPRRTSSDREP